MSAIKNDNQKKNLQATAIIYKLKNSRQTHAHT